MTAIRGYNYAPRSAEDQRQTAAPGELVANAERGPPWLVVDHALTSVIVTSWPGRLLAVEVTDPVTAADLAAARQTGLTPGAVYTRAVGVRVLEELPTWWLFGPHGESVVEIIEAAQGLTVATATTLAAAVDPGAARAYSAAWDAWLVAEDRADSIHRGHDHVGTLEISARNRVGSPIYQGFSVIAGALRRRAIAVTDGAAVEIDEEGESSLVAPWTGACDALLYAAMALGAPHLTSEHARARLLRAWMDARP